MIDPTATDDEELAEPEKIDSTNPELVGWVMEKVVQWRMARKRTYDQDWQKYYAIWRCQWSADMKQKNAERSRIIAPATQNAVDQAVSEMAEAVFGRGDYVDLNLAADASEQDKAAAEMTRQSLLSDLDRDRIQGEVIKTFFNGAVYGTGISKRSIGQRGDGSPSVSWEAVAPYDFVIDTAACLIEDALGCAHETTLPVHAVTDKQISGEYFEGDIGSSYAKLADGPTDNSLELNTSDGVDITEYHGKVPKKMLNKAPEDAQDKELLALDDNDDATEYVEAIVTIANGSTLLKAVENPFGEDDRGFIAYQHYTNPNNFWGIGVCEKAYNSQMGLDAELRARIDALSLLTYPVVGADATRLPKNLNLTVLPGKVYMTNGRASEIIEPLKFGQFDPVSFQQSQDFERMVNQATGGGDTQTPVNARQEQTASGMSMQTGSFIKRAKLTMQNVDVYYLDPLVTKTVRAYVGLDPQRYPLHAKFTVNSTMSIMAREFEQVQMTNLLAIIPQNNPAFNIVLKAIINNYSGPNKAEILAAVDQASQPDPQQQQMQQQVQQLALAKAQKEVEKLDAEISHLQATSGLAGAKTQTEMQKPELDKAQVGVQIAQTQVSARKAGIANKQVQIQAANAYLQSHAKHMQALKPPKATQ
jgi:hypothetical protein